jgi:hypothetical protein
MDTEISPDTQRVTEAASWAIVLVENGSGPSDATCQDLRAFAAWLLNEANYRELRQMLSICYRVRSLLRHRGVKPKEK